jgi:hypothetical protein
MGMFGSRGLTASQQVSRGGDGTSMALAKPSGPDWHRIAGIVGDALSGAAGQPGMYARSLAEGHQQQAELQRQMALGSVDQWQNPDPTSMQRNYEYLKGIDPHEGGDLPERSGEPADTYDRSHDRSPDVRSQRRDA